ncbi:multidrug permease ABC transporter [Bifidobacterium myosotis]|uniref:Multidrug permease ABC transporter n=1 Tax=Bifidobacterium myosotis TaxID=1630166 RepID=A0A261FGM5_9BIFI|nr:ABC transporter permease [Bifidobacterium myosotis]OZG58036.1 multidrug permease ABC transporter [Bifidobacterium myosotis]
MNTCKATVRVLVAHRLYIVIYLVLIGIMMFAISGAQLFGSRDASADTYEPGRATVAVIDRDGNRGHIAETMRAYLADGNDLTELEDRSETLQQAVASHWVDLIVIIPEGYADKLIDSAVSGGSAPAVETVTSYVSGAGAMASMNVSGFLSMTRTALVGGNVSVTDEDWIAKYGGSDDGQSGGSPVAGSGAQEFDWSSIAGASGASGLSDSSGATGDAGANQGVTIDMLPEGRLKGLTLDDLADAAGKVRDVAGDKGANPAIAVDHSDARADAVDTTDAAVSGFGTTMKTALYPLFLAMTVCTALVLGVFNEGETRRRLFASPQRSSVMGMQRMAALCAFALIVVVAYLLATLALMLVAGLDLSRLSPVGVAMTVASACVYALMTVACGFLLGECDFSEVMANGFANLFGLLIMFTSGISLPLDMMPEVMLAIGRMLPGWWYCVAVDDALGIGTASAGGVDVAGWAASTGLVALFGVAFLCVGLAVGRLRRSRPVSVAPATTQLA